MTSIDMRAKARPGLSIAALAGAALVSGLAPTLAHAASPLATHSGALVHWEKVSIVVGMDPAHRSARVPADSVHAAITEAAAAWNALPEMTVQIRAATPSDRKNVDVWLRFCKGRWQRPAGLLGHTEFQANIESGRVDAAVIEINECDQGFVGPDEVRAGSFDLQAVLTHEFGHVLGLGHSIDPDAVMFTSTGTVRQRRPKPDDRDGIRAIYRPEEAAARAALLVNAAKPAPSPAGKPGKDAPRAVEMDWPEAPGLILDESRLNASAAGPRVAQAKPSGGKAAAPAGRKTQTLAPANAISITQLGAGNVTLYTCEPTILPAIATAKPGPRGRKARPPAPVDDDAPETVRIDERRQR